MTIAIAAVRVTPIAISDPPLLNAAGVHEPFGLRSIIEVEGVNGLVSLGETYGDAPVLDLLTRTRRKPGGSIRIRPERVVGTGAGTRASGARTGHVEMELAPGAGWQLWLIAHSRPLRLHSSTCRPAR